MSAWPLYRAMVGVGLVCGFLIVVVFQATAPVIARNRALALESAILEVLPGASTSGTFRLSDDNRFVAVASADEAAEDARVHAAYDGSGALVGLAVEAAGMGYQDTIHILYGYSLERHSIVGFGVLESRETPGLGDRIESDPEFLRNFESLDVALDDRGQNVRHPIVAVARGAKTQSWEVDSITGATISSKAIANMLRSSTERWIPLLEKRVSDFVERPSSSVNDESPSAAGDSP